MTGIVSSSSFSGSSIARGTAPATIARSITLSDSPMNSPLSRSSASAVRVNREKAPPLSTSASPVCSNVIIGIALPSCDNAYRPPIHASHEAASRCACA